MDVKAKVSSKFSLVDFVKQPHWHVSHTLCVVVHNWIIVVHSAERLKALNTLEKACASADFSS